jgi:benzodiazapine receptor
MSTGKSALGLLGWLVACFAAASVGSQFVPGAWYATLTKPAWLVWRRKGFAGAGPTLAAFGAQLVLNALWSFLFFGLHRPGVAFADIVALWIVIFAVTALFWRVDWRAGALMVPYLVWVGFASFLNFALWRLNAVSK